MGTLPGRVNLFHVNSWQLILAAYLNWLVKILIISVTESRKWSESKQQLAGFIFAHGIPLAPSLSLLDDFVVQSLLLVLLCLTEVRRKKYGEGNCLGILLFLGSPEDPIGWARLRGLTIFLDITFMLFTSTDCTPFSTYPVKQYKP